jgi:hypothetical protein
MASTVITGGTLRVADGPTMRVTDLLPVAPEVAHLTGQVPDPKWRHTDSHGHQHRWWIRADHSTQDADREAATPTLVSSLRHVDCDATCGYADCGGYDQPVWHCIACGTEVVPGFTTGTTTVITAPGYWVLTTEAEPSNAPWAARTEAELRWPSGAGRITVATGWASEIGSRQIEFGDGSSRETREFHFTAADSA